MQFFQDRKRVFRTGLLSVMFLTGTVVFFSIDSGIGYRGPRVDCDGIYFWLYLRSLAMDGDVDFTNDYARYGNPWNYGRTKKGKPMNPATIGSALLWSPLYLAAHGGVLIASRMGRAVRTDGTSHAEELAAFYGTYLYGWLAILLLLRICRRHYPDGAALLGTLGVTLGGTILFYMIVQPSYSHAQAAMALAAFVERWDATRGRRTLAGWAILGALGGLAMLIRPQLAVVAVLPLFDLTRAAVDLVRNAGERRARALRLTLRAGVGGLAAIAAFSPQMIAWKMIHGSLITIPQGKSFMQWGASLWSEALFHPRAGLLPWMPLAAPALLGLGILAWRKRELGLPLLVLFAMMAFVNGACWDWWAGYSYGARRFTCMFALLGLGLTVTIDAVWRLAERHARALSIGVVCLCVLSFCVLNLQMMGSRRKHNVHWKTNRQFYKVYVDAARRLSKDVHRAVGNPLSWPANLAFGIRHGVSPGRYDEVAGRYLLDEKHGLTHRAWSKTLENNFVLTREWFQPFLTGFGKARRIDGRQAVPVEGDDACVMIPLVQRPDILIRLSGRAAVRGTQVRARFNGSPLGSRGLDRAWQQIEFNVSSDKIERGVNKLCLSHTAPAGQARSSRRVGATGVEAPLDLALLSAGYKDGDRAEIWVGGVRVGTSHRGVNAVAIDAATGAVRSATSFDTCTWPSGSKLLASWVGGLERGTIVLLAARDDASRKFSPAAFAALKQIGARTNLGLHFRHGYVAVGLKGALPGSAVEKLSVGKPAVLSLGARPPSWSSVASYDRLVLKVTKEMTFD